MQDCCVRVTVLLEYFEWTLSKQHNRAKGKVFLYLFLSMLKVGVDFYANQLVIKGRVPALDHYDWY